MLVFNKHIAIINASILVKSLYLFALRFSSTALPGQPKGLDPLTRCHALHLADDLIGKTKALGKLLGFSNSIRAAILLGHQGQALREPIDMLFNSCQGFSRSKGINPVMCFHDC